MKRGIFLEYFVHRDLRLGRWHGRRRELGVRRRRLSSLMQRFGTPDCYTGPLSVGDRRKRNTFRESSQRLSTNGWHQEYVGENAAENGRLDNSDFSLYKSNDEDNEFLSQFHQENNEPQHCQNSHSLKPRVFDQLELIFPQLRNSEADLAEREKGRYRSEWDDSDTIHTKDNCGVYSCSMRSDSLHQQNYERYYHRDEYQEEINPTRK